MFKIMSADEAAQLLKDGDVVGLNAFGSLQFPEELSEAIGRRFLKEGHPRDMGIICIAGQGAWIPDRMVEHMSHEGMLKRVVASHLTPMLRIKEQVAQNKIEGYNLPAGPMAHMFRASAGRKPCIITKIGLGSFVDPRQKGPAQNEMSKDRLVEVIEIDGEEYLMYKVQNPTIAILRGTTADCSGNITMEKEGFYGDPFAVAMAAKAHGGKVIVQVERLSSECADPTKVKIPGTIVDAVVVSPTQMQSMIEVYNPTYTGDLRIPENCVPAMLQEIDALNLKLGRKRTRGLAHQIIARRAAMELQDGDVVNLGIGVPEMIPNAAAEMGLNKQFTLTVEAGPIGGVPSSGVCFGASINPEVLHDMAYQFDFYDGGGLNAAFLGALQVDCEGNVNVSRTEDNLIGIGGFIDITQTAKKVVYCFPFSGGGVKYELKDGALSLIQEGMYTKFCERVFEISSSAAIARREKKTVLYITERCVFRLDETTLCIIEIAPGIDLQKDVLDQLPFQVHVSKNLKEMDASLFRNLRN